jgi:regulator of sigma E protease
LFYHKKAWQRAAVILAGPLSNILLGVVLFTFVFLIMGIPSAVDGVQIDYVQPDSPAQQAGLQPGMQILRFKTIDADTWQEATTTALAIDFLSQHRGYQVDLQVRQKMESCPTCGSVPCETSSACVPVVLDQELSAYLRTSAETPPGEGALGIAFKEYDFIFYPWYKQIIFGIGKGFVQSFEMIALILDSLSKLVLHFFTDQKTTATLDVIGPVGMVNQIQKQGLFEGSPLNIIQFAAILSVNLGIMNLLPFPALDGGKLVMIGAGKLFGRKKIATIEGYFDLIGFAILILLMLVVTTRDVWQLFKP